MPVIGWNPLRGDTMAPCDVGLSYAVEFHLLGQEVGRTARAVQFQRYCTQFLPPVTARNPAGLIGWPFRQYVPRPIVMSKRS